MTNRPPLYRWLLTMVLIAIIVLLSNNVLGALLTWLIS